ncbi:hypothetical protein B296_00027693 [Ensete ventricosum]|uniref:Uncharacterized protein n=1 Tax=Ensete ventricosum TaxID=4639 RepID=A0A426ZJR7_ENSVE|nr:hypothetical protein B296_00027693 [Ensete ventricosum]
MPAAFVGALLPQICCSFTRRTSSGVADRKRSSSSSGMHASSFCSIFCDRISRSRSTSTSTSTSRGFWFVILLPLLFPGQRTIILYCFCIICLHRSYGVQIRLEGVFPARLAIFSLHLHVPASALLSRLRLRLRQIPAGAIGLLLLRLSTLKLTSSPSPRLLKKDWFWATPACCTRPSRSRNRNLQPQVRHLTAFVGLLLQSFVILPPLFAPCVCTYATATLVFS